jgi:hypothetical protein
MRSPVPQLAIAGKLTDHRKSYASNVLAVLVACLALLFWVASARAETAAPWWHVDVGARPSVLTAGRERTVVVSVANLGDKEAIGEAGAPIVVMDTLPEGVKAEKAFYLVGAKGSYGGKECDVGVVRSLSVVTCSFEKGLYTENAVIPPYMSMEVDIYVSVENGLAPGKLSDGVSVSGGGAPAVATSGSLTVGTGPTGFGVETFESVPENAGGSVDTQAGSHPFQWTNTLVLNAGPETGGIVDHEGVPTEEFGQVAQPALPRNMRLDMPPGMLADPSAFAKCTEGEFKLEKCPAGSQIGVALVTIAVPLDSQETVPLFNMVPARGEPARFGFDDFGTVAFFDASVRTGGDYGVTISSNNITQTAAFLSIQITTWGWPGDPRHNDSRGYGCVGFKILEIGCSSSEDTITAPFLSLPTACGVDPSREPFKVSIEGESWPEPALGDPSQPLGDWEPFIQEPVWYVLHEGGDSSIALDGCNKLGFEPSIKVTPDVMEGSKPSGLTVDVHDPQQEVLIANGLAQSAVKNIVVALPEGLELNPSAGDGLTSCSQSQIGFTKVNTETGADEFTPGEQSCPDSAKIATVTIHTPLLPNPLTGAVYLASPQNFSVLSGAPQENPFQSLVAMYLVAADPVSGTLVKLPGEVSLCENAGEVLDGMSCRAAGQIIASFEHNPELPFEDAELEFFGGERAPLATPALCRRPGEPGYRTQASFAPWSGGEALPSSSEFDITTGPGGAPCPNPPGDQNANTRPFAPTMHVSTSNIQAGAFTPLTTSISREDGQQDIQSVQLHMPAGLSGLLSGVTLCPEPQANAGACGEASLIGETIVSVGLGGDPFSVTGGKVYITGPYNGTGACNTSEPGCAPFGLSIVNPAKAGPFDLQEGHPVVVRAKVEVDPTTAALTITTNPSGQYAIPHMIEGIPLQIKHVNVTINHQGFAFNPTDCDPASITGTISSDEGVSSALSVPFQVTNCANLKFAPKFSVSTSGKTSKADGASLTAKVAEPSEPFGSQANIARVKVELPEQLPSRLTTLQKACTNAQFEANPAGCPAPSVIGHATVHTPLVPVPLEGPVYFVSHGGEAFPSLEVVLQGYGVKIVLVGTTFISKAGITSTTFKTVPDQPFSTFEITLPEGPYSALTANGNLCAATKTVTVKKKITIKHHGKNTKVTRKVKQTVSSTLEMPTEFIAQNGAELKQNTKIEVNGCPKAAKKTTKKHTKKTKKKK